MIEVSRSSSLDHNSELVVAAIYEREVDASLERVWENVYDWEHLPWLHSEAFDAIDLVASGDWGWHARVELAGAAKAEIELITNRDAGHYVARTLDGAGAPSEIWTSLNPIAVDRTAIHVEFCVMPMPEAALRKLGDGYVSLYTLLWNQDEGMMKARESALADRRKETGREIETTPISLGRLEDVRSRLPLVIEFGRRHFRIIELDGELIAHSTECPHLLGPLEECEVVNGSILCPWHGYRFDIRTGQCANRRSLRLRAAPQVAVDAENGQVTIEASRIGESAAGRSSA
jgi:nitrite reductase/ring-hydroxylating ferredoxin subunit